MVSIIINNLKKIDNPLATTLVNVATNNTNSVEDSFYQSTVFGSKEEYQKKVFMLENAFTSNFGKPLVNTPLAFVRGNGGPVFTSAPGKGMTTGLVLFDYVSKNPLLLVTVDKVANGYKYHSVKFNSQSKEYQTLTENVTDFTEVKDLANFVKDLVSADILTFVE